MYMPSIFNNSVFDNFDNWMDFSFPSFNQRLYGASSSQLMKTDVKETDKDYEVSIDLPGKKGRFICSEKPLIAYRVHAEATTKACIEDNRRPADEMAMFRKMWPDWMVKILMHFYRKAYKEYEK